MKKHAYTVSQVNDYIGRMFAQDFMLRSICIKGEVSNCKYHSSGHIYFTIKDEKAAISAVMFAGSRSGLSFRMQEGDKVLVTGSIQVFEREGRYQIYAKEIQNDGAGSLFLKFEALKQELYEMGMFADEYKKPIPKYIHTLGIVTAPTGAAVQDIRNIAGRRNPYVQLILYPAKVQGEGAAESIVKGIQTLDAMEPDVIIVGRGGGSIEDLWAFNEEIVARAIFECQTPVISAVGHETDTTIADFVADLRASTPSAGAELAVYDIFELYDELEMYHRQLRHFMTWKKDAAVSRYENFKTLLQMKSPQNSLNEKKQYAANLEEKLQKELQQKITEARYRMGMLAGRFEGVSPVRKLSQGLAFVTDVHDKRISAAAGVNIGDEIRIRLQDGLITADVVRIVPVENMQNER